MPATYRPSDLLAARVAWTVAAAVWPLLAFFGLLLVAALAWFAYSGDPGLALLALLFCKAAVLGLVGSFAVHEAAHAAVLARSPGVTGITVERTGWRVSLIPEGTLTRARNAAVALSGPLTCGAIGAILYLTGLDRGLAWWYMLHLVFLLPLFGDGRALLLSLRPSRT